MTAQTWQPGVGLTRAEQAVLRTAEAGDLADFGDGLVAEAAMRRWGAGRTIRAEVLRHLLLGIDWPVHAKGVRVRGARIRGQLDLTGAKVTSSLRLDGCYLDPSEQFVLDYAAAGVLCVVHCHLGGLTGEMLSAKELDLSGSTFNGPVRVRGADIAGGFSCRGAQLKSSGADGRSLVAERLKVGGEVFLDSADEWTPFTAAGAVVLDFSEFACSLNLTGADLGADSEGSSLSAAAVRVGGDVNLNAGPAGGEPFTAAGTVWLGGAVVTGTLDCTGARLGGNPPAHRVVLGADRIRVGENVTLDELFAAGAVGLPGATIAGSLRCLGSRIQGQDDNGFALNAQNIEVGEHVRLDDHFTAAGTVWIPGADIGGQLVCQNAQLTSGNNEYDALVCDSVKVDQDIIFDCLQTEGGIRLAHAEVGGQVVCTSAGLGADGDGDSLVGDHMKVGGTLAFNGAFTAAGVIRLPGAEVGGELICTGAELKGGGFNQYALYADGIRVSGSVLLDTTRELRRFRAERGGVSLRSAEVAGDVSFRGADLQGSDEHGICVLADGIKVGGDLQLDTLVNVPGVSKEPAGPLGLRAAPDARFSAAGAVMLRAATITGNAVFSGAVLKPAMGWAGRSVVADSIQVAGNLVIDGGFKAAGTVSLRAARVDGALQMTPTELASGGESVALDATEAQIARTIRWAPAQPVSGRVILEAAAAGQLEDDWTGTRGQANGYWPVGGLLRLDGFTYGRFGGASQATVHERLSWIRSQFGPPTRARVPGPPDQGGTGAAGTGRAPGFTSQPYEHLAETYRQAGHDTAARAVAIARRRDLRRYGNLTRVRKAGNLTLDITVSYGYRPLRAAVGLAAVFLIMTAAFWLAQHYTSLIAPTEAKGLNPMPTALRCTPDYPCFYPVGYAVDTVIPIINVHQAEYWDLGGHAPLRGVWIAGVWVATLLGWAFATLAVAGYTGLVRKVDS